MTKEEILLKEYEEGNKVCMHYESFRRQGTNFFIIVQGAIASILFSDSIAVSHILKFVLPVLGLFVGFLTLNNDIRVIAYYYFYLERLKEIEKQLGMKLYSEYKQKIKNVKFTTKNNYFYRGLPIAVILFWLLFIISILLDIQT